ncbi:MAG TPA: EI24 domain-containing protein [Kamptonema sp.]|nr:EI24 domain-containing protein [Kamptonema sp.]
MIQQQGSNPVNPLIRAPLGLLAGASYPFRALGLLLQTPKLWGYVLIPLLVNLIVCTALYLGLLFPSLHGIDVLVADLSTKFNILIAGLPTWLSYLSVLTSVLGWLLRTLLVGGLLLVIGFLLVQFGVILGAPWYGQLSEQLELLIIGKLPPADTSFLGIFGEIKRALGFELRKLQLLVSIGLPLLLLSFIPAVGSIVVGAGSIALGATLVCLDFLSAPLDRRRLDFRDKLELLRANFPASATFGLVCFGLVSIPLLNLLTIPLCLVAGTLFFCDRIWPSRFAEAETSEPKSPDSLRDLTQQ